MVCAGAVDGEASHSDPAAHEMVSRHFLCGTMLLMPRKGRRAVNPPRRVMREMRKVSLEDIFGGNSRVIDEKEGLLREESSVGRI